MNQFVWMSKGSMHFWKKWLSNVTFPNVHGFYMSLKVLSSLCWLDFTIYTLVKGSALASVSTEQPQAKIIKIDTLFSFVFINAPIETGCISAVKPKGVKTLCSSFNVNPKIWFQRKRKMCHILFQRILFVLLYMLKTC